ncbi:MAG: MATE family efflux transporter [Pseudohongiellaceae bacterium]|nr:MAG: MATE family efflux transporter [Gammaproteobacteria bacterium RIFCSPLOWO2_02_FULL_57_10]
MTVKKIRAGLSLFKQALVGSSTINYTEGSIAKATFLLAVPMILEMAMESVFAIVDIFFVAGLGAEAVATVGLTEAVMTLLYAVAIGLSMGTTAMVARRIGEDNAAGAAFAAGQALWMGIFVSVFVGVVGFFYAEKILALMGAEPGVIEGGTSYIQIMLSGSFTIVFLFLNNAIFRGAGDASIAMRSLMLANGINIVLDPMLIYGVGPFPDMGVTGAAVATNIGRGVGVAYQLWYLCANNRRIQLGLKDMIVKMSVILALFRISVGGIAQFLIATASWVFLMRLVSGYGSDAIAGYTISLRIMMFTILPAWGLSNAVATLVGQNLGAEKPERAESTVWQVAKYNVAYMVAVALVMIAVPEAIIGIFTQEPAAVAYGVDSLRIMSYAFAMMAVGMVAVQAFNGAGDTMTPTWINVFCYWIVQVPVAWWFSTSLGMGPNGVFWSIFIAEVLMGVVGVAWFMRGSWKRKMV